MTIGLISTVGLIAGGVSFGFSGFAFAIFGTAALALTHPPQVVVPAVVLIGDTLTLLLLYEVRAELRWEVLRKVPPFAPWSAVFVAAGLLAGGFLLGWLGPAAGRLALGALVLAFVAFQVRRFAARAAPSPRPAGRWAASGWPVPGVGFASGLLDGWLGAGGVALAIVLVSRGLVGKTFAASAGAYFITADLLRIASYAMYGYWGWPVLRLYLQAVPIVLASYGVGVLLRRAFPSPLLFQKVVVGLLGLNGLALILRTLLAP